METKTQTPATICAFEGVNPINTVKAGIYAGHYDDYDRHITDEMVPLKVASGAKKLYLVCFGETIGKEEHIKRLRAIGKQPCRNAPPYLLGLMAKVPEDKMPPELHNKYIIAVEPNASSVFADRNGNSCFLCVDRIGEYRKLDLIGADRRWLDY